MKQNVLCAALALCLCLCLAGCGAPEPPANSKPEHSQSSAPAPEEPSRPESDPPAEPITFTLRAMPSPSLEAALTEDGFSWYAMGGPDQCIAWGDPGYLLLCVCRNTIDLLGPSHLRVYGCDTATGETTLLAEHHDPNCELNVWGFFRQDGVSYLAFNQRYTQMAFRLDPAAGTGELLTGEAAPDWPGQEETGEEPPVPPSLDCNVMLTQPEFSILRLDELDEEAQMYRHSYHLFDHGTLQLSPLAIDPREGAKNESYQLAYDPDTATVAIICYMDHGEWGSYWTDAYLLELEL